MLMNSFHWPNRSSHPHPLPLVTLAWGGLAVPATANIHTPAPKPVKVSQPWDNYSHSLF